MANENFEVTHALIWTDCPLKLVREQGDGLKWSVTLENTGWCDVVSGTLEAAWDGKTQALDFGALPAEAQTRLEFDIAASKPAEHIGMIRLAFSDGVVWENVLGKPADLSGDPVLADPDEPDYDLYAAAWQNTRPLYQTQFESTYWRCGCGQVNGAEQSSCLACGVDKKWAAAHACPALCRLILQKEETARRLAAEKQVKEQARRAKRRKICAWVFGGGGGLLAVVGALTLLTLLWFRPATHYHQAERYLLTNDYFPAYREFIKAEGYGDAAERAVEMQRLLSAEKRVSAGYLHTVKVDLYGHVEGVGRNSSAQTQTGKWNGISSVSAGELHTVGLHFSGTAIATGNNDEGACNVSGWTDIVSVGAGSGFSVGLKSDGTVVATGKNDAGQCDLSGWTDIAEISVGKDFVLGLKNDGTVVIAGNMHDDTLSEISSWTDIIYIAAGGEHALGLKADGTVVAAGNDRAGALEVGGWTDVIALTAGDGFSVGLKADGTLVACGINQNGQTSLDDVTDVVAVISGWNYTITLQNDGSLLFFGSDTAGEGLVGGWTLF